MLIWYWEFFVIAADVRSEGDHINNCIRNDIRNNYSGSKNILIFYSFVTVVFYIHGTNNAYF